MKYASQSEKAVEYFRKCLREKDLTGYRRIVVLKRIVWATPANSAAEQAELDELIVSKGSVENAEQLLQNVTVLLMRNDTKAALENCNRALEIAVLQENTRLEITCCGALSNTYNLMQRYRDVEVVALRAIFLTEKFTNYELQKYRCRMYCHLVSSYENRGMNKERDLYLHKARELSTHLGLDDVMADVFFSMGNSIDISDNNPVRIRKAIDHWKRGYEFCHGKQPVHSILKSKGFIQLGICIVTLQDKNSSMVKPGELDIAYEILHDLLEKMALVKYNPEFVMGTVLGYSFLCGELGKHAEAMKVLLSVTDQVNLSSLTDDELFLFLGRLYNCLVSCPVFCNNNMGDLSSKREDKPFREAELFFEVACRYIENRQLHEAVIELSRAFAIVLPDCAIQYDVPVSTYISMLIFFEAVCAYYEELCTS